MNEPLPFEAVLELLDASFGFQCVVVPEAIAGPIFEAGHRRVVASVQKPGGEVVAFRQMLHRSQDVSYVRIGAALRKSTGAKLGDTLRLTVAPDLAPDEVDLPPELEAALAQTGDALAHYRELTAGTQRSLAYWVSAPKLEETRIKRALELANLAAQGKKALLDWHKAGRGSEK